MVDFYLLDLGLKASFKPSPMKLIDKMVIVIRIAGGIQIHSLNCNTSGSIAESSMFPQLGISCGTPKPRKLNADSITIIDAKVIVAWTIIVDKTLGNRCLTIIFAGEQPIEMAAIIYSFSFSARILLRTILAIPPQLSKLMTPIKTHSPFTFPKRIAFKTITNTRKGKFKIKSVNLINKLSTVPPKYPATEPINVPRKITNSVQLIPINNEIRPPYNNLVKTSRPALSVPSQCLLDGSSDISPILILVMSAVVIYGARNEIIATNNKK